MMHKSSLLFLFTVSAAAGGVWTVDNNPGRNPDFIQVTEAIAFGEVVDGDTLYVAGSSTQYTGNIFVDKRLVLIGPGYLLDENTNLTAANISAFLWTIVFSAGSEGSIVTGFDASHIQIDVDSITIARNYFTYPGYSAILLNGAISNIVITQNYITNDQASYPTIQISASSFAAGVIISNNYINNLSGDTAPVMFMNNASITNNVLSGDVSVSSSVLENNIMLEGTLTDGGSNQFHNNLVNSTQLDTLGGVGNQSNIDMATVFVGTGTTDGQWELAVGSPAIGAGVGGVDAGMYGGPSTYISSGLPSIPVIEYLSVPTTGSQSSGLKILIKARGQN